MTQPKRDPSASAGAKKGTPSPEELRRAGEIHTLCQMIYGRLATEHPWLAPVQPLAGFEPPPPFVAAGAAEHVPGWSAPPGWTW